MDTYIVFIVFFLGTIPTGFIPLIRWFQFRNKIIDIKNTYFKKKVYSALFWISILLATIFVIYDILRRGAGILAYYHIGLYACLFSVAKTRKEAVFEEGIKTKSHYIKWHEIKSIERNGADITVDYQYRYFFYKENYTYIIENCSQSLEDILREKFSLS